MKKLIVITFLALNAVFNLSAQDSRKKIVDYVDVEIYLDNGFAGESLTLVEGKKNYFVIRKLFGSGVPVVGTYKYIVKFNSDWQIDFWDIVSPKSFEESEKPREEIFRMSIENDGISVYLNGLKLSTDIRTLPNIK